MIEGRHILRVSQQCSWYELVNDNRNNSTWLLIKDGRNGSTGSFGWGRLVRNVKLWDELGLVFQIGAWIIIIAECLSGTVNSLEFSATFGR